MKNWFSEFEGCLKGDSPSADLIGGGRADSARAMAHYRYQHLAKMKEAVEVTFPALLRLLGDDWKKTWDLFWAQNETSPRSLDWFPEVFLNYFLSTSSPLWLKELARFEHHLDIHPWTHKPLSLKADLVPDEKSKVVIGHHEVLSFHAPVTELYRESFDDKETPELVLMWQKESGVFFRKMSDWEMRVFNSLDQGMGAALEHASDDPEAVGEFFRWLGSSCLIQGLKRDSP
jgi:hypothetical protein